jgi:hypothetical protein
MLFVYSLMGLTNNCFRFRLPRNGAQLEGKPQSSGNAVGFRGSVQLLQTFFPEWGKRPRQVAENGPPAENAAERGAKGGWISRIILEMHPTGAKAPFNLLALSARLKLCPFKTEAGTAFFRGM